MNKPVEFTDEEFAASGELTWQGESVGDVGIIKVKDSEVTTHSFDAAENQYVPPLTLRELEKMALAQLSVAAIEEQQDDHDGSTND